MISSESKTGIWFTSDFHFGHKSIIQHCNRPFANVESMDDALIKLWNDSVKPNDLVYFLGDLSFHSLQKTIEIVQQLSGRKHWIKGNHDSKLIKEPLTKMFEWVKDVAEIKVADGPKSQRIFLSHYCHRVWNRSHYGAIHLFGHSHGTLPDDPNSLSLDVGIDAHELKILSYENIKELMSQKTFVPVDHHGREEVL